MRSMRMFGLLAAAAVASMLLALPATASKEDLDRDLDVARLHYKHAQRSCYKEPKPERKACLARVKGYYDGAVQGFKQHHRRAIPGTPQA